jgi:hypothetical protein
VALGGFDRGVRHGDTGKRFEEISPICCARGDMRNACDDVCVLDAEVGWVGSLAGKE